MIIRELPDDAQVLAAEQGWSEARVGLEILRVLKQEVPDWEAKVTTRLEELADDENSQNMELD